MTCVGTRWDRSSTVFIEEWLPRLSPYQLDLSRELGLRDGERILVPAAGPDVLAFARAVAPKGTVRATETRSGSRSACTKRLQEAGFSELATVVDAPPTDTVGAPFDVILCAFGLREVVDHRAALVAWRDALTPKGKVGLLIGGPADPDDPRQWFARAAREVDPSLDFTTERLDTERGALSFLMESAGLALVRHTVVSHTITFHSTEEFVRALCAASEWRDTHAKLGPAVAARITARVCERAGGPDKPIVWNPAATIAISGLPGAEIELPHRPSVRIPAVKGA